MGKARIAITPVTTIENSVDFLSSRFSGLIKVIKFLKYSNLNWTGSSFELMSIKSELYFF